MEPLAMRPVGLPGMPVAGLVQADDAAVVAEIARVAVWLMRLGKPRGQPSVRSR